MMRQLRLLITALATICVFALGAFALVDTPPSTPLGGDDEIIIKGGSLEVQCGKNHKNDNAGCLALDDGNTGKYKHKQPGKQIKKIVVKTGSSLLWDSSSPNVNLGRSPEIEITYK